MIQFQRHYGNFADALKQVALARQRFATSKEGIVDRMKQGVDSDACKNWAWFDASFNEVDGTILATKARFNPLSVFDTQKRKFVYAQRAVDAHRKTEEFYLTDDVMLGNEPATQVLLKVAEQDEKKPIYLKRVIDLGTAKTHSVPTDCYADDPVIVFLAEGHNRARQYGLFVRNAFPKNPILESKVYMQDLTGKNKSRGFALGAVTGDGGSDFGCNVRYLYYDDGSVFVVSDVAEGDTKNLETKTSAPLQIEAQVIASLRRRQAFTYNGTLYVPVSDKRVSLTE